MYRTGEIHHKVEETALITQVREIFQYREAVRNMVARYTEIEENFPPDINDQALPFFLDWLLTNVHVVEITAYSDDDAYTIFETMNDRGLSLAPLDMLKSFLIANVTDVVERDRVNAIWKQTTNRLLELDKEEPADAVKTWLRSQYADSIRERGIIGRVPEALHQGVLGIQFENRLSRTPRSASARSCWARSRVPECPPV